MAADEMDTLHPVPDLDGPFAVSLISTIGVEPSTKVDEGGIADDVNKCFKLRSVVLKGHQVLSAYLILFL